MIYRTAVVSALEGRADQALTLLERLVVLGYPPGSIATDDDFDGLRTSPRFLALTSSAPRKGGAR